LKQPFPARLTALTALTVITASAFVATPAFAQADAQDPSLGQAHRGHESPQNFAAEVRFAAFTPEVDSDPKLGGETPYKDTFGSAPRLEIGLEFDWQALRIPHLGTIGPGLSAGYTKASDPALFQQEHNGTFVSGEQTTLEIFPFYGVLVLRADVLWRDAGVPLVPYGKIGLGYALWRASNTVGTSHANGISGEGSSFGTQVALGLAFNLNPFDIYAAQNFDDAMGVNNSYIFAEWTRSDLDGSLSSQKDVLRVGGTAWTFGLAFEF
jgi:opacity protein-like surface antigen